MITDKESLEKVKLTIDGESWAWGYLVDGYYFDFDEEYINSANPYGCKYIMGCGGWSLFTEKEPRTKEEYEIVECFSFALEADFNAGILFRPNELDGQGYLKCETEDDVAYAAANEMLFRKVTKPIEWWEDLVEYIEKTTDDSGYAESKKGEKLNIVASMTRDQWCDFARILLEQGE